MKEAHGYKLSLVSVPVHIMAWPGAIWDIGWGQADKLGGLTTHCDATHHLTSTNMKLKFINFCLAGSSVPDNNIDITLSIH